MACRTASAAWSVVLCRWMLAPRPAIGLTTVTSLPAVRPGRRRAHRRAGKHPSRAPRRRHRAGASRTGPASLRHPGLPPHAPSGPPRSRPPSSPIPHAYLSSWSSALTSSPTTQPPPFNPGLPRTRLPYCPAIWQGEGNDAMSVPGLRREDFPVLDRLTYLNTASAGLVPASVVTPAHEFELELAQAGTTDMDEDTEIGGAT